ncbi:hypothetical protein MTO96_002820 [Rhipicephalus appendiculatus]
MRKKDYDASWYMCETKDSIRVLMVLYAFVTFLAMVAEVTSTVVTARNTDYHRRPYVWIMGATYSSLRLLTLIVIVYWIVAATKTNIQGMRMAFNIVFVRVIGNLVYNVGYFVTDLLLIPDTLSRRYRMIIHPDMIPKDAVLLSVLGWTVLECFMLDRMNQYEVHSAPQGSSTSAKHSRLTSTQTLSPSYAPSPAALLSPTVQKLQSPRVSRVTSPVVLTPTKPRLPSRGDVSRVASPPVVRSPQKGAKARPSGSVAPSRVGSPTGGYAPATRATGSVAPSRVGSPTRGYAPATRATGSVAPSRVGSPTRGYAPATRATGSVAPSRVGSPTVAYSPAK